MKHCFVNSILALGAVLFIFASTTYAAGMEADMVIYNGKILTIDSPDPDNFRTAQAAAIFDGRFVVVGTNDEALQLVGADTVKLDLGGRTVLPGLVETHQHIYAYGSHFFPSQALQVGSTGDSIAYTTKDEFLGQLRTIVLGKKPGQWIITSPGRSRDLQVAVMRGEISRFDLDRVAPENPVYLHWSQSVETLLNTKALEPVLERYPDIPGVRKDAQGVPTGSITGVANLTSWYEFWPQVSSQELGPYYKMEMEETAAQGITTLSTRLSPNDLAGYQWLWARNDMPIRMGYTSETVSRSEKPDALFSRIVGMQGGSGQHMWGLGDDMLWMIGTAATFAIDGTPDPAASCVSKPYPREAVNFPLWRYQFYGPYGLCRLDDPDYRDADGLRAAAQYGFRISAMHSGGDRGIDQFLDIVEEMSKQYPDIAQRRWAIDHCRYLTEAHAQRAAKFNIMFSCGPKYVYAGEKGDIGAFAILFGADSAADSVVPLRRLIDHGLRTTMQLDQHGFYPFLALEVAVNRKDITGKVWGPQQRINRREALYMYTRWSSEYLLKENSLGTIEPKKLADFTVLNRDYLTVPEDELGQIDVLLTVMGGKIVYSNPEFATSMKLPQIGFRGNPTWWLRGTPEDASRRGGGE